MNVRLVVLIVFVTMLVACSDKPVRSEATNTKKDSTSIVDKPAQNGLDAEPLIKNTDSLQILFYDNPDGDSLRYTRYFTFVSTIDTAIIADILSNLNQPFTNSNTAKDCRSEGKMYLYERGEPLKTIYFSTRCDTCCYLYFIKDGAFLYFPITDEVKGLLKRVKSSAKKP